ncbi:hypothetical protein F5Y08DRAFT_41120 [Xylaria arbuscula]|nr:hypothetical protein F5Y08DRAFT_41120 [Xylaria arbuscula]
MAPDYYHLNGPGHQGPRRNESQHRPQGPAPGPLPRGNPQGQPQGQPPMPPAPPRNILPVDLRGGPPVQIVDITQELPMSQSDMQEELTDYIVFQYEKVADKDALDDYGQPKWPSWEKAIRVEDRSISKRTAADKVRQLNQTTKGIIDKKNSLTPALKRQIDSTLEYLMKREPDPINFHWYLAQIDHQLRRIKSYHPVESNPHYVSIPTGKHRSANAFLFPTKKRSRSRGRSGNHHSKKKKKAYERISLTAYFKRVPRQGVNVAQLWHEKRMYQAQQGHNVFPQMQPNQAPFQGPQHQAQPGPPRNRPPPNARPNNPNGQGGGQRQQGPMPRVMRQSESESDSDDSRGSSSGGSRRGPRGSPHTPPSSVSDRGHRQLKDHHGHHHPIKGAAPPHRPHNPRNERPRIGHRSPSPRRSPRIPVPPYPTSENSGSVASHIEQVRRDAYRRGQLRERADARLVEELADHGRPRPYIVQDHPSHRLRRVYRDHDDLDVPRYLADLSLDDDRYEDYDYQDGEYRREFERRRQQGSILDDDPFDLSPSSPSSSYTYSTDTGLGRGRRRGPQPQIIEITPRLRRRPSYLP